MCISTRVTRFFVRIYELDSPTNCGAYGVIRGDIAERRIQQLFGFTAYERQCA